MPVMQIGIVRVPVDQAGVLVRMGMRLTGRIVRAMRVLMVLVMHMRMIMPDRLMDMLVFVRFDDVEPDAGRHQDCCRGELQRDWLIEDCDAQDRTDEGRGREIGSSARGAEMA